MCHELLKDANVYRRLFELDIELAEQMRARGCGCGGPLHRVHYRRKPRGPSGTAPELEIRFSFCCGAEGCRKRSMPPSVRFLGRRVYWAVVVTLVTAAVSGLTAERVKRLRKWVGVDRRTLTRWITWWHESFPRSSVWQSRCSRFLPPIDAATLPGALLARFPGDPRTQLTAALSFLAMES